MIDWLRQSVHRFGALFHKTRMDRELEAEMASHLELAVEESLKRGLSAEEARRQALIQFGGVEQAKERHRDSRGVPALETVLQDVRFAWRTLRKSPGFTAVVLLTLALGIGANTAVFTLMDAVMIKVLPVKNPQQLVLLGWVRPGSTFHINTSGYGLPGPQSSDVLASFAYPFVDQLRFRDTDFSSVFGFVPMGWSKESVNVSIDGEASMADGVMVTGDYFSGLGVLPLQGRMIIDTDMNANAPRAAVISYRYWTRRFGRSPSAVGKGIFINGVPFTIVGVAPPEFFGVQSGHAPDLWLPLVQDARLVPWGLPAPVGRGLWTRSDWWWVMILGRLKSGVSEHQALAAANGLFLQSAMATANKGLRPTDAPQLVFVPASRGLETLRWQFSQPLWVLTVVVSLVLLIVCANIATLLLARAMARHREVGIRLTLGATRWRLIRQLLTESVLLSTIGGALGLFVAHWGSRALLLLMSSGRETLNLGQDPDLAVLGFCAGLSVLTGILFSLVPVIRATNLDPAPTLKGAASEFAGLGSRLPLGKVLVIGQVALSLLVLVGAGLFLRTLANLENQNLGFNRHNLLVFAIDPTKSGYEGLRVPSLCENVRERLQTVPGVQDVTFSQLALLTGWVNKSPISVEGYQAKPGREMETEWDAVGPDFFQTMGIRLLLGRTIDRRDSASSTKTVVVNEAIARNFFGSANPIGRRISFDEKFNATNAVEIVGVVENAKYGDLRTDPMVIYRAFAQTEGTIGSTSFEVRTAGDPTASVPTIRTAVHEVDPNLALTGVKTQTEIMTEALAQERWLAQLSGFFGCLALVLAAIGLYGLMAYSVTRRTREIGIRMAFGARRRQVLRMVLLQSFVLVVGGAVAGLLAGIATTRLIASQLYGLRPTDPLTLGMAALLMFAVAALAAYLPARRATKVDPMVALRYE
jgi:predicted permease